MSTATAASVLSDQDNVVDTASSTPRRHSLSTSAYERLRAALLADSYAFTRIVAGHKDLIPSIHMPISYMVAGLTDLFIHTLQNPALQGYVQRKLRAELHSRNIDPTLPESRSQIDALLNGTMIKPAILNIRMSRRFFKSSVITHGGLLYIGTRDPNETIKITHAVDPKAWEFCDQIGRTVLSDWYRELFPDRLPKNPHQNVSQKRIELGGRTISHPQSTFQASGYQTKEEGAHYNIMLDDDLVTDDMPIDEIAETVKYLQRRTGFYMPTKRIRLIEVGTKHDEDDDDGFFTRGVMQHDCFTLRVPIEEHRGRVINILQRGTPTCPELFPSEKISAEQAHVLSNEEDENGYRTWWNQYLLSASGGKLRLFPSDIVDDPFRQWLGPYAHPNVNWRKRGHFLIAHYRRSRHGDPLQHMPCGPDCGLWTKNTADSVDGQLQLRDDWFKHADILSYDPWADLDRVIVIDPSWSDNTESDNWSVNCVGQDNSPIPVRFQLETRSATTGLTGWVEALIDMEEFWQPRAWGIDATAAQDPVIENLINTDQRLRRLRSRMIKIHHNSTKKTMRMQEGLAEPLAAYTFLLAPRWLDETGTDRFGGTITRNELKLIKSTPRTQVRSDQDGIADGLSMSAAVNKIARRRHILPPEEQQPDVPRTKYDDYLGIPLR